MTEDTTETAGRELVCAQCGEPWTFTEREEAFLREKFGEDFSVPKRCIPCRKLRREQQDSIGNR